MKLVMRGRHGARVCDWESYALLRDNVQHYLEQGAPGERFSALHAIEQAVERGSQQVDAAKLRGEVLRASSALDKVQLEDAAISLRTRAILTQTGGLPEARGTVPARAAGWSLPLAGKANSKVARAASRFIQAVMLLTETAVDGDSLNVHCVGRRSRSGQGSGVHGSPPGAAMGGAA